MNCSVRRCTSKTRRGNETKCSNVSLDLWWTSDFRLSIVNIIDDDVDVVSFTWFEIKIISCCRVWRALVQVFVKMTPIGHSLLWTCGFVKNQSTVDVWAWWTLQNFVALKIQNAKWHCRLATSSCLLTHLYHHHVPQAALSPDWNRSYNRLKMDKGNEITVTSYL